jgi:aryl-alcohol dehydrogenase-like predicted oxidoreductase
MNYRLLGKSELLVSELSFGCMSLEVSTQNSESLLRNAVEHGINYFDTADLYNHGLNEEMVGRALSPVRNQIIIATKVGNKWKPDASGWDWNPNKKYILKAVEESLRRLRTDYIDLYQLHGGTLDDPIDEIAEAFELLKEQGKIRAYGLSSIRPNVIRKWANLSNIASVMMQYSALDRRPEENMLTYLNERKISVITRGTLAKGLLATKPPQDYLNLTAGEVRSIRHTLAGSGNPVAAALFFALRNPAVATACIGIRTHTQLHELLSALSHAPENSFLDELKNSLPAHVYKNHR